MVSLIVTNYVQYVFLAAGTVVVTLACLREVGWSGMVGAVEGHMDGRGFNPIEDLGIGFILWQVLLWIALMTVWQSVAMRTFSTRDAAVGKRMFTLTGFLFLGRALIPMAWGIAALAFFWGRTVAGGGARGPHEGRADASSWTRDSTRPSAATSTRAASGERSPRWTCSSGSRARRSRSPRRRRGSRARPATGAARSGSSPCRGCWPRSSPRGILGLVVAGMLAASISTYAGYFLGWSSIIAQDIVAPLLGRELSSPGRLRLTRVTVVGLTVFIMIWSLVYDLPGPAYFYLQVTANLFMAPTLIAVVGGLYWRRASSTGAGLSFLLGASASLAYLVPQLKLDVATAGNLSWALAVAGFVIGSLLFRRCGPGSAPRRRGEPGGSAMSWAFFWLVSFAVAFLGFSAISLVIAVRGVAEIRELFSALEEERRRGARGRG